MSPTYRTSPTKWLYLVGLFSGVDPLVVDPLLLRQEELLAVAALLAFVADVRPLVLKNATTHCSKSGSHQSVLANSFRWVLGNK